MSKTLLVGVAFALLLLLAGALFWQPGSPRNLPAGADFVLDSADGPIDSKALRGKVLLIFFGYTHCPDICPASLATGAQVLNALSPGERARVKLLLISVDPERDTLARLKMYTAYFHPEMLGATGSPEKIAALARAFGAAYVKQAPTADGAYAVDHTASTYVVGPEGKLAAVFDLGTPSETLLQTLRQLL